MTVWVTGSSLFRVGNIIGNVSKTVVQRRVATYLASGRKTTRIPGRTGGNLRHFGAVAVGLMWLAKCETTASGFGTIGIASSPRDRIPAVTPRHSRPCAVYTETSMAIREAGRATSWETNVRPPQKIRLHR